MSGLNKDRLIALYPMLDQALDLARAERTAWLDRLRAEHPDMAPGLEALLEQEDELEARGFLEGEEWLHLVEASSSPAGLSLGAYTIDRPLGRGGMGSVWLAHRSDGRYEGTAAVKLLNLALLDPVGRERFRREGTTLARLTHPGIARLLDAGVTTAGQPFLVLEYVEGRQLDRYCDEQRLPPDQRLALFLQVLAAVGHAHANLIVHRDLKPSNILVTSDGSVKLLDFGIAKLLDAGGSGERSALTLEGGRALTPEFGAPEQVRGDPITTATDVYALGVLLYLLLSGRHPTGEECRTPADAIRALLEVEPTRLRLGDLDNILAKALRKAPGERYQTVTALADDIQRYLRREPVSVRADSLSYRAGKFLRRHRATVGAGAIVAAGLIGATVFSVEQMREAKRQRDAAILQTERADAQIDFQELLISQVGDQPLSMRQILDRGREGLERQYGGDSRFLGALLLQLSRRYADLGQTEAREELLNRAESLAVAGRARAQLAEIRCNRADHLRSQGSYDAAWSMMAGADSILRRHSDPSRSAEVACLQLRAYLALETGKGAESEAAIRRALAIKDTLGETADRSYPELLDMLGGALDAKESYREALAAYQRAGRTMDSSGRGGTLLRVISRHNLALTLTTLGETAEAERLLHDVLQQAARGDGSGWVHWQPLIHYAEAALTQGHADSAVKYFGMLVAQAVQDSERYWEARGSFGLARAQLRLGRVAEARRTTARFHRLAADYPRLQVTDDHVPDGRSLDGLLALATGDTAGAHAGFMAVLRSNGYFEKEERKRLRLVAILAAETALALGHKATALELAREALASAAMDSLAATRSAWVGEARLIEGRALLASGDTAAGQRAMEAALPALRHGAGDTHPRTREAAALLRSLGVSPSPRSL